MLFVRSIRTGFGIYIYMYVVSTIIDNLYYPQQLSTYIHISIGHLLSEVANAVPRDGHVLQIRRGTEKELLQRVQTACSGSLGGPTCHHR